MVDSYGAEQLFIRYFISDGDKNENYQSALEADFPVIAREFFTHEKDNIASYRKECIIGADIASHSSRSGWRTAAFELIYVAAKKGSAYSKELLRKMYRSYYNKEYNELKWYSSLTKEDLQELCKTSPDPDGYDIIPLWENGIDHKKMARLMIMSGFMGVELDCGEVGDELADSADRYETEDSPEPFPTNQTEEEWAIKECLPDLTDPEKFMATIIDEHIFTEKALQYYGYRSDFVDTACPPDSNIGAMYGLTNLILKKAFPGREFDKHEFGIFYGILHAIQGLNGAVTDEIKSFNTILGLNGGYENKVRIKLDDITAEAAPKAEEKSPEVVDDKQYDELKKEVEALQFQLQKSRKGESHYKELYERNSRQSFDASALKQQYEAEHAELVALREHVYSMTEIPEESGISIDDMKRMLSSKKLVIIGGNSNWVLKLKELFPDWVFVGAGRSGTIDEHILDNADFVYFFTDTMSHSVYYRFIQMVRNNNLPFAYIHGVNLDLNIRQMYKEVIEK